MDETKPSSRLSVLPGLVCVRRKASECQLPRVIAGMDETWRRHGPTWRSFHSDDGR